MRRRLNIGFTVIDHKKRLRLEVDNNEYTLLDIVYRLQKGEKARVPGWCDATKEELAGAIGLTKTTIVSIGQKLNRRGYLEKDDTGRRYRVTVRVVREFEDYYKEDDSETNKKVRHKNGQASCPFCSDQEISNGQVSCPKRTSILSKNETDTIYKYNNSNKRVRDSVSETPPESPPPEKTESQKKAVKIDSQTFAIALRLFKKYHKQYFGSRPNYIEFKIEQGKEAGNLRNLVRLIIKREAGERDPSTLSPGDWVPAFEAFLGGIGKLKDRWYLNHAFTPSGLYGQWSKLLNEFSQNGTNETSKSVIDDLF